MASTPVPVNQAALDADKLIKMIEGILVPIAENAIIAAVPSLGLPVVKQITQTIEQALSDKLTKLAETGVTFGVIDYQVDNEQNKMQKAIQALEEANKSGDQNAIQKAKKDFEDAQDALATDDGSATAQ